MSVACLRPPYGGNDRSLFSQTTAFYFRVPFLNINLDVPTVFSGGLEQARVIMVSAGEGLT